MEPWFVDSRDPERTHALGCELGRAIGADGLVIALVGPLGAGKTVFVKGLAEGLGVDPRSVSSPTFVIAQQYFVPGECERLHHVDLYRLERVEELDAIGFDDMFAPGSVMAVEWADRFPGVLGPDVLRIELEGPSVEPDSEAASRGRRARVSAKGATAVAVASDWRVRVNRLRDPTALLTRVGGTRALLALALAGGLLVSAVLDRPEAGRTPCSRLLSLEEDAVGTLTAYCADADPSPDDRGHTLQGVGRLLEGGRIDANRATSELLAALPGIGPVRADAIVRTRREHPFASVSDLERVPGIGPAIRARLARWVTVERLRAEEVRGG